MDIFDSVIHHYQSVSSPGGTNLPPFHGVNSPIQDKLDAIPIEVTNLDQEYGEERKVVRNGRPIISALRVASSTYLESCLLIVTQNSPENNGYDCKRYAPSGSGKLIKYARPSGPIRRVLKN
jgi:hypothetical protein